MKRSHTNLHKLFSFRPGITFCLVALLLFPVCLRADDSNLDSVAALLELVIDIDAESARKCLDTVSRQIQSGEVNSNQLASLRARLDPVLEKLLSQPEHPLNLEAAFLLALWKNDAAVATLRSHFNDPESPADSRLKAADTLIMSGDDQILAAIDKTLADPSPATLAFRGQLLSSLGKSTNPRVAGVVLAHYAKLEPELKSRALELLTQRPAWSALLLEEIAAKRIPAAELNASQLIKLQTAGDDAVKSKIAAIWGNIRAERNPQREQVVADMRTLLSTSRGDAHKGIAVFQKVCGQCHKLHGQGHEVGPDLTANGRASFEQLLSNVFDPSLVIGPAYQARVIATDEGRILTGLLAEENEQRIVLKTQGGKVETIARDQVEEITVSRLSLMPEGLEKQLTAAELADLFAYITLDLPPDDPRSKPIPGTPVPR